MRWILRLKSKLLTLLQNLRLIAPPVTLYVGSSGSDTNDGLTLGTARRTLRSALDADLPVNSQIVVLPRHVEPAGNVTIHPGVNVVGQGENRPAITFND